MKKKGIKNIFTFRSSGYPQFVIEHSIIEKYSNGINNKIRADYGIIEEILNHQPSIGNYYERILSSNLQAYLPSNLTIGTGFIFDDLLIQSSPQIDIVVYDETTISPIFKIGDLIVIRPEQVRGVIEVKKRLKLSDVDNIIEKYLFSNLGYHLSENAGYQYLNVFSYDRSSSVEKIFNRVVESISKKLESLRRSDLLLNSIQSISLPRFFFLNDNKIIETRLVGQAEVYNIKITLDGIPYTDGGASDLFTRLIWPNEPNSRFGRISFSSVMLYEPILEEKIEKPLILRCILPTSEFLSLYSSIVISLEVSAMIKDMSGFSFPYGIKIENNVDFISKIKSGIIAPILHPEDVD